MRTVMKIFKNIRKIVVMEFFLSKVMDSESETFYLKKVSDKPCLSVKIFGVTNFFHVLCKTSNKKTRLLALAVVKVPFSFPRARWSVFVLATIDP